MSVGRRLKRWNNWSLTTYCKLYCQAHFIWTCQPLLILKTSLLHFLKLQTTSDSLLFFLWRRAENDTEHPCITSTQSWGRIVNHRDARSHSYSSRWDMGNFLRDTIFFDMLSYSRVLLCVLIIDLQKLSCYSSEGMRRYFWPPWWNKNEVLA